MDFKQAEDKFKRLKAQFTSGSLSKAEFKAQLEDLMVEDEHGDWWMIGYETEKWFRNDGTGWVQADPPGLVVIKPDDSNKTNKFAKWGCLTTLIGIPALLLVITLIVIFLWNLPIIPVSGREVTGQATSVSSPTRTMKPTAILTSRLQSSTATPNIAATEEYRSFFSIVQYFQKNGLISTLDGEYIQLDSYSQDMAYLDYYKTPTLAYSQTVKDFIFSAHFYWSTAIQNSSDAGCGIVFGLRENSEGFQVFLDKTRIWLQDTDGEIGKTSGTGKVNYGNPADAIFTIVVSGQHVYVYVDNKFVGEYTLSQSANTEGQIGYTLLSGTNKDYGTHCEIEDAKLWVIGQ